MHLKTHFKFQFKSSKNSTTSAHVIFLLNTTLHCDSTKISITPFGSTKLYIQILQNSIKMSTNELASLDLSHWRLGPTGQGTPHVSSTKTEHGGCDGAGMVQLTGGYFSGENKGTGVFYSSIRAHPQNFISFGVQELKI